MQLTVDHAALLGTGDFIWGRIPGADDDDLSHWLSREDGVFLLFFLAGRGGTCEPRANFQRGEAASVPSSSSKAGPLVEEGLGGGPFGESTDGREAGASSKGSFTRNPGSGAGIFLRVRGSASSDGGTGGDSGEAV